MSLPTNSIAPPLQTQSPARLSSATYLAIAVIMGCMGLFFWAIRGTGGFGGSTGGIYAGMGWGVLWLVFSHLPGLRGKLSSPWMVAAITFGIGFGGMTGYGIYISWLRGQFYLNYPEQMRDVASWTGYAMLFICGLQWGGVTGALMAWCHPEAKIGAAQWLLRIISGVIGALLMLFIVRKYPQLFLPFYAEGIYDNPDNATCIRAIRTIDELAPHLGLFFGFLAYELLRQKWTAVKIMLTMSLGFAIPFCVGGYWQTFQGSELKLDWWKYWEMSIGLGGGLALGLAFYWFNTPGSHATTVFSNRDYLLGAAFPIWIGVVRTLINSFDGILRLHGFDQIVIDYRTSVLVACLIPITMLFAIWVVHHRHEPGRRFVPLVLWLAVLSVVAILIHNIPVMGGLSGQSFTWILILTPAIGLILGHVLLPLGPNYSSNPISSGLILGILALMCVLGILDSMPYPMRLGNYVLVGSYLICITVSGLLGWQIYRRQAIT